MKNVIMLLAVVMAASFGGVAPVQAANWYWFGDDTTEGGDGAWNYTDIAWRTHPTSGIFTNYVAGNAPLFRSNPGTVTLETNILVSSSMNVSENMTFDGPFTLQISGGTHVTAVSVTATVNCAVQLLYNAAIRYNYLINGNISDDGANRSITHYFETLTLNGSNSFGGGVALNGGTLVIGNDDALGTGTLKLGYNGATLEAGGGARTVTNHLAWNWNWRLNFRGTNNLTFARKQTLQGTASPWPRYNVVETNAVLTYGGGLVRDTRFNSKLIKEGPGTMVVDGPYDASYGTVVTGGTFIVNSDATVVRANYGYTVYAGAALGGTGVVNLAASGSTCVVHQAGALVPGSMGVGTLTVNGPVSMAENSIYKWEYKDGAGDLVDVNGTLTLPLVATVTVSQVSGDLPATPTLFTADTLAGPGAADVSGWIVQGESGYAVQILGSDVVLSQSAPAGTLISIR